MNHRAIVRKMHVRSAGSAAVRIVGASCRADLAIERVTGAGGMPELMSCRAVIAMGAVPGPFEGPVASDRAH